MLFEGLEEDLDFPAIFVHSGDGGGPRLQMVGQEDDLTLSCVIPEDDMPETMGAFLFGFHTGQTDGLVYKMAVAMTGSPKSSPHGEI